MTGNAAISLCSIRDRPGGSAVVGSSRAEASRACTEVPLSLPALSEVAGSKGAAPHMLVWQSTNVMLAFPGAAFLVWQARLCALRKK
jgi:hypothetical protein